MEGKKRKREEERAEERGRGLALKLQTWLEDLRIRDGQHEIQTIRIGVVSVTVFSKAFSRHAQTCSETRLCGRKEGV